MPKNTIMYNTDFKVKYYDIEQELLFKLLNKSDFKNTSDNTSDNEKDNEYTSDDIITICDKLYRDEVLSVFYAESIVDDKLDKNMQYILDEMICNPDFKKMVDETKQLLYLQNLDQTRHIIEEENPENNDGYLFVLLMLFSQTIFHITHKCICQQLTTGTIDKNLLSDLKTHLFEVLHTINGLYKK
jgi:hypothetical protein